jgi:hypothetical protein
MFLIIDIVFVSEIIVFCFVSEKKIRKLKKLVFIDGFHP